MKKETLLQGTLIRNNQGSVIVHEEGTLIKHLCFSTIAAENAIVVECKNSSPHDLQGFCLPVGTKITITAEIPEPPQERIVLPEGMRWDELAMLWTADGTLIAKACVNSDGWYRIPFMLSTVSVERQTTLETTKRVIESALAEHNYFGVKKVVDNE